MSAKHTPGPWEWGYSLEYDLTRWALRASGNPLNISGRSDRAKANRALIAEAPTMLLTIRALLDFHAGVPDGEHELLDNARALVARLDGAA